MAARDRPQSSARQAVGIAVVFVLFLCLELWAPEFAGPADASAGSRPEVPALRQPRASSTEGAGKAQWRPGQVPNPDKEPEACGLPKPGWLCDPDGILSPEGRAMAMNAMLAIREKTSVQCPDGERGYQVGVALIRQMHPDEWTGSKEATATKFAQEIGDRWGVGDPGCGNGIMLFLSLDDRFAYIKTSGHGKLTDALATTVVDNMKPLLREADYDGALLQAVLQVHDVLQDKSIPGSGSGTWSGIIGLAIVGVYLLPVVVMLTCGLLTCLLMPLAWCLDTITGCVRRCRGGARQRAADLELQRVRQELDRGEFEQSLCAICLEPLEASPQQPLAPTALDCRHCFHRPCIDPWIQEHGSCPLCRADVQGPLAPEDEARPQEYQRRLRFYMSRLRLRHPEVFAGSPSSGRYGRHYYDYYYPATGRRLATTSYATSLRAHYQRVTSGAASWMPSGGSSSGSGGRSSGSFGGGGGFSSGGGGGGGW